MAHHYCQRCGTKLIPGKEYCPGCSYRVPEVAAPPDTESVQVREYKVIGTEEALDLTSGGRVNKQAMEKILNTHAKNGWCLKTTITRQLPGLTSITYESILILERDVPSEY